MPRPGRLGGVTPAAVIRSYLLISGVFTLSASVIWGVNTLFLLDAGLDIFEVFIANAAFTAGMVLFEIPTGVVADTAGRRRSFLLSAVTLCAGTLAYVGIATVGWGLVPFVGASILLGLGFTFYSGAVEAWLVDALAATGYEGELDEVFARGGMVSGAAMLIGSVGGGVLGAVDLAWPFVVRAALLAAAFVIGWRTMFDRGFTPRATRWSELPRESRAVLATSLRYGWGTPQLRLLMAVSLVNGGFAMWGFYAWQPYVLELLDADAIWITGVISALAALSMIAGNRFVESAARSCGRRTTLLIGAFAVAAAAAVGIGVADSFWPVVLLLLVMNVATGVATPVQQAYQHAVIPSAQRATVMSFSSLLGSAGGIGGQLGLGYLSRARSVAAGYVVGGVVLSVALVPLGALRRRRERADLLVGRRAGVDAPCAGQGMPPIAHVDPVARHHAGVGRPDRRSSEGAAAGTGT